MVYLEPAEIIDVMEFVVRLGAERKEEIVPALVRPEVGVRRIQDELDAVLQAIEDGQ